MSSWDEQIDAFREEVISEFSALVKHLDLDNEILDEVIKFQIKTKAKWEQYNSICSAIIYDLEDDVEEAESQAFISMKSDINMLLSTTDAQKYAKSNTRYRVLKKKLVKVKAIKATIDSALKCIDDLKWGLKHKTDLVIKELDGHIL